MDTNVVDRMSTILHERVRENRELVNCKEYIDKLLRSRENKWTVYNNVKTFLRTCILSSGQYERWIKYTVDKLGI